MPDEIHGFLWRQSWLRADSAQVEFLTRRLSGGGYTRSGALAR
jgi:hypothetical protein